MIRNVDIEVANRFPLVIHMLMKRKNPQGDLNRVAYGKALEPPAGARVWVRCAGHLTGGKRSHYISNPTYVCPHIVLKGQGVVRTAYGETEVGPGDMFWLMPGVQVTYSQKASSRWVFYWIHITGRDDQAFAEACRVDSRRPWFRPRDVAAVTAIFREVYEGLAAKFEQHPYRLVSLLYALADACQREFTVPGGIDSRERLVADARVLIESQLADMNVNRLASILRVDRTTLFKAFQAERGESPIRALQAARIAHAKRLLREGEHKCSTIAFAVGFANDKSFSRAFRQHEGMSPRAWQRSVGSAGD